MRKNNLINGMLLAIAAMLQFPMNRLQAARTKLAQVKGLRPFERVSKRNRRLCPRGAGAGPAGRALGEQHQVGQRSAQRRQVRFFKSHWALRRTMR